MTPQPLETPTKECPYCHGHISGTARICSCCWKDLETGAPVVLDTSGKPLHVVGNARPGPMKIEGCVQPHSEPGGQTASETGATAMKICMHCGATIPGLTLLCAVCGRLQDSDFSRRLAGRSGNRRRRVLSSVMAVVFLGAVAAGVFAAYRNGAWIQDMIRKVKSRPTSPVSAEPLAGSSAEAPAPSRRMADREEPSTDTKPSGDSAEVSERRARVTEFVKPSADVTPPRVTSALPRYEAPAAPQTATPAAIKAVCASCSGEGYYLRNPKDRQRCPVCGGRGFRMLSVPSGHKICPDCQGIGQVEEKPRAAAANAPRGLYKRADRCERCAGKGYVKGG